MPKLLKTALVLALLAAIVWIADDLRQGPEKARTEVLIDRDGPRSAWGKALGDIDGDGKPDIIVGGHEKSRLDLVSRALRKIGLLDRSGTRGELVWYRNPTWQKTVISDDFYVRTDLEVGDIDGDGQNDLVVTTDRGIFWLANPDWSAKLINVGADTSTFHDVELSDLDRDGDLDIIVRNQSLFGHEDGNRVYILYQQPQSGWREQALSVPHGEGLKVGDLDGDGYDDIVVNGIWLRNPASIPGYSDWDPVDYTSSYEWADVYIAIHDIDGDGNNDIVLSPAEPLGLRYRISWFGASESSNGEWIEHIVDSDVESVHHAVAAGDFDGDGDADIFSAEMNQGEDPDEVKVYLNGGDGLKWRKSVLGTNGSHSIQVADLDSDNRVEAIGANWHIDDHGGDYPVILWESAAGQSESWKRHVIGDNGPWRNLFVLAADIDGDRYPDVVAGRSWFRNPGVIGQTWSRREIGGRVNTALYLADFDADGDIDVFGSEWDGLLRAPGLWLRLRAKVSGSGYPGARKGGDFLWAANDGRGQFKVMDNIEASRGDYPQGVALHNDAAGFGLVVSWHQSGNGIDRVSIPRNSQSDVWPTRKVSSFSQDEEVSSIDLNGDGVDEVITGTSWLEPKNSWKINTFYRTSELPDRHELADIDGDGAIDVVIGYEAVSSAGKLAWYSDIVSSPQSDSSEHVVDYPTGPMSIGAADFDGDRDVDLVVGEHNLADPDSARLLMYWNPGAPGLQWSKSVLSTGDEHHNGALVVDLDLDGDNDIVSIGWGHSDVILYENRTAD